MNVIKCIFIVPAVLLAVTETAVSGEKSPTVVKEAGLRSDGELVQAKQSSPRAFKSNNDDTKGGTAYKPRLKDVFVTSYSTSGSADLDSEPPKTNKLNSKQPEE